MLIAFSGGFVRLLNRNLELVSFALGPVSAAIDGMGADITLRQFEGENFITDNGNLILDCAFGLIKDPVELAARISNLPGVVEDGLFIGLADELIIGSADAPGEKKSP